MNKIIFTTTDGYPIRLGDRYHIVKEDGIAHWICEESDEIPTCDTYRVFENARDKKIDWNSRHTPIEHKGVFITEDPLEDGLINFDEKTNEISTEPEAFIAMVNKSSNERHPLQEGSTIVRNSIYEKDFNKNLQEAIREFKKLKE